MADEKMTVRDILMFPIVLFGWTLLNLGWRWEAADNEKKRQKRAKQLEAGERKHQAGFQYEVYHSKNSNAGTNLENLIVAAEWLREYVGQQGVVWDFKVNGNEKDNVFIFTDETHAAAFKLAFT